EVRVGDFFCGHCGIILPTSQNCPACQNVLRFAPSFCPACGTAVAQSSITPMSLRPRSLPVRLAEASNLHAIGSDTESKTSAIRLEHSRLEEASRHGQS